MAVTLSGLRTELLARGFDYLSTSRANGFVNDGLTALYEWEATAWPFLETTVSGSAPLTVSDLREVLYVVDTTNTNRLREADSRDIVDEDVTLAQSGTPDRYWLDGLTTVKVWPVSSVSLSVRYLKVPALLSSDGDTALVPDRYQRVAVDLAVVEALKDASNTAEAQLVFQAAVQRLNVMRDSLMSRAGDDPDFIVRTQGYESGGW